MREGARAESHPATAPGLASAATGLLRVVACRAWALGRVSIYFVMWVPD